MLEERAENLRLLYVALTRAKYRCWMVWGDIKERRTAAPAWLLHRAARSEVAEAFGDATIALTTDGMRADLERIAARAEGAIGVAAAAAERGAPRAARKQRRGARRAGRSTGALRDTRRVTSFTALAHGRTIEAPDYDACATATPHAPRA